MRQAEFDCAIAQAFASECPKERPTPMKRTMISTASSATIRSCSEIKNLASQMSHLSRPPRGQQRDKPYREALRMELAAAGDNMKKLREIARAHIARCERATCRPSRNWLTGWMA